MFMRYLWDAYNSRAIKIKHVVIIVKGPEAKNDSSYVYS